MVVSKPLSIVLQLIVLGLVISGLAKFQDGFSPEGLVTLSMAAVLLWLSRKKKA